MKKRNRIYRYYTVDDYDITENGEIINKHTGRIVKPQPNGKGYLRISIGKKLMFVHRLVAEKYIPNPDNLPQVNHKDGNKTNNCVDNLEWVSNSVNRKHAVQSGLHIHGEKCPWSKLTLENVNYIRNHPEMSKKELSEMFKVSRETIRDILIGRSWK